MLVVFKEGNLETLENKHTKKSRHGNPKHLKAIFYRNPNTELYFLASRIISCWFS